MPSCYALPYHDANRPVAIWGREIHQKGTSKLFDLYRLRKLEGAQRRIGTSRRGTARAVTAEPVSADFFHLLGAPAAPAAAAPKGGQPPRPGLVSCAGRFEGRYASTGFLSNITIVFPSGKAIMSDGFSSNDPELECWTGGGKIYLHKPGDSAADDFPIDINNDGTLQTPFGEVKKKGN